MSKKKKKCSSLAGKFLIASPAMPPSEFSKTVILMAHHTENGAVGYCVNRMGKTSVKEVIRTSHNDDGSELDIECNIEGLCWAGGPCQGPLIIIHDDEELSDMQIVPGVQVTFSDFKLKSLNKAPVEKLKVITGYAGWKTDQLEQEMRSGTWLVVDATADEVFSSDENEMWKRLKQQAGIKIFQKMGIDGSKVNAGLN